MAVYINNKVLLLFVKMVFYFAMEAFISEKLYVPKELCIIDENGVKLLHALLTPICKFNTLGECDQKQNKFLTVNHHNIVWNSGYLSSPIESILNQYFPQDSHVIVKGEHIRQYLELLRSDLIVHNVDDMIEKVTKNNVKCDYHYKSTINCAYNKALHIFSLLNK